MAGDRDERQPCVSLFCRLTSIGACNVKRLILADQSFSDFPLLLPPAGKAVKYLSLTHELSASFLRGKLDEAEILQGVEADAGMVERDDKGKMSFKGDIALHLRGER